MESNTLGSKIRHRRHQLGLTLDELAIQTRVSKPYLSLIETGRVPNPPSHEKLRRIEQSLSISRGELMAYADIHRTPASVLEALQALLDTLNAKEQPPAHRNLYDTVREFGRLSTAWCGSGI